MNNLHKVQNIFISNGTALPANNATIASVTPGKIGVYGTDMLALDPAGSDTITTQPAIYIVEGKTDSDGINYVKRSTKINGQSIINYTAKSFLAPIRSVSAIGYDRKLAVGTIEVNTDTNYNYTIRFKNDKFLYSERPEVLNVNFTSSTSATQLSIATQISSSINNSSFKKAIISVVVGDGTGIYGLTGATNYGVEIWALDINQFSNTTYTPNNVYFSVHVNDASGFGTTTTSTKIQSFSYGNGTYNEVFTIENKDFAYEGVLNRRLWPIPVLDYSSVAATIASSAITPTVTGTISEDTVTFSATVAGIINPGDKVDLGGVVYEIKYFIGISSTIAVLTSVLTASLTAAAVLVKFKYDIINIEYNDSINTPTGVVAVANKSVVIAVPSINAGAAYTTLSSAGTNVKAILDAWMFTTPGAFGPITI